jgi:hypothetical protein
MALFSGVILTLTAAVPITAYVGDELSSAMAMMGLFIAFVVRMYLSRDLIKILEEK